MANGAGRKTYSNGAGKRINNGSGRKTYSNGRGKRLF